MLDLIECARGKLDDPIVMRWALRRYQQAQVRGPDFCQPMEEAWFDELVLRRWIDGDDRDMLEDIFRILPVGRLARLTPAIVERWSAWSGPLAARATQVLAECSPDQVRPLLARHLAGALDASFPDLDKTAAAIDALVHLPHAEALALLGEATARIFGLPDSGIAKTMLSHGLLRPTAVLNPDVLVPLVEMCARAVRDKDPTAGGRLLRQVYGALFGNDGLMEKATELIDGDCGQPFFSLQPLFASDAPLDDCDRVLAEPEPWGAARALLERHCGASAATQTALAIAAAVDASKAAEPAAIACFATAAVLRAFAHDEIGADSLSMDAALDVLALDLPDNPHVPRLSERLAQFPAADVARGVEERIAEVWDEWGAVHLAALAGELRLVATIPMLIDCLDEDSGSLLSEPAETALVRIGEPAAQALAARWDSLDTAQQSYGRYVIEATGSETALAFTVERFQPMLRDDPDGWCSLAAAVPDRQLIGLIEPHLRRQQPMIDRCFYLLSVLTGHEHGDLPRVGERIRADRQRTLARRAAFEAGDFAEPDGRIALTLRCERCGDVNRYRVKSVITAGRATSGPAYFVGDDIPCASCGQWVDFELTGEAHMQMMGAMLRHVAAARSGPGADEGPLKRINVTYRWQTRPAPEVLAELREALARHPENIVNHLRLARLQHVLGRRGRARECYARALLIEPDAMEAGLGLAQTMADAGETQMAFDKLCRLLHGKSRWRFFRTDELSPQGLTEDLSRLYNKLHAELGVRDRALLCSASTPGRPESGRSAKVGRNDPCPCGSGKKFKKCCSETGAFMLAPAAGSSPSRDSPSILRRNAS